MRKTVNPKHWKHRTFLVAVSGRGFVQPKWLFEVKFRMKKKHSVPTGKLDIGQQKLQEMDLWKLLNLSVLNLYKVSKVDRGL